MTNHRKQTLLLASAIVLGAVLVANYIFSLDWISKDTTAITIILTILNPLLFFRYLLDFLPLTLLAGIILALTARNALKSREAHENKLRNEAMEAAAPIRIPAVEVVVSNDNFIQLLQNQVIAVDVDARARHQLKSGASIIVRHEDDYGQRLEVRANDTVPDVGAVALSYRGE